MLGLLALLAARPAFAWEQMYTSAELTLTLGAPMPMGFAVAAQFGEAPVDYRGPEFKLVAEVGYNTNGWSFSALGRAGAMTNGEFGYTNWSYYAGPAAYTEVGYTLRIGTWSGLRVGGGVSLYLAALRYHQLIPLGPVPTLAAHDERADELRPTDELPLPARHPSPFLPYDMQVAFAFEPWMFPAPLASVYRSDNLLMR